MKKETVILMVVIAFLVGFITGATVANPEGDKRRRKGAMVQKPQMAPIGGSSTGPSRAGSSRSRFRRSRFSDPNLEGDRQERSKKPSGLGGVRASLFRF